MNAPSLFLFPPSSISFLFKRDVGFNNFSVRALHHSTGEIKPSLSDSEQRLASPLEALSPSFVPEATDVPALLPDSGSISSEPPSSLSS